MTSTAAPAASATGGVSADAAASGRPTRARSLLGWRTVAVLFAAALLVRVVYCLVILRDYSPVSDAEDYYKIAVSVSEGRGISTTFPYGYEHPTAFRPPLFPALLGAVFTITGPSLGVTQAVQVLLGSSVVVLLAVLAARCAGRRAGLIAGGFAAIYPPLLANDGPPLTEPLALVLLLGGLLALGSRRALLAGVLIGALVLTRPSAQLLVPVIGLWLLLQIGWRRTAVFVVAVAVIVLPWVVRNQVEFGKPVLVTSNGFNMNAAWSEVSLAQGKPADGVFDPRFAHLRTGAAATNEAELDANLRRNGLEGLRRHKSEVPGVVWRNARFLLDLHVGYNNGAERYDGRNLTLRYWTVPVTWVVLAAGVVGLLELRRRRAPDSGLLLLSSVYFLLISVAAVSPPRLRAPLDVLFLLGTATLVATVWERFRRRRQPPGGDDAAPERPAVIDLSADSAKVRS